MSETNNEKWHREYSHSLNERIDILNAKLSAALRERDEARDMYATKILESFNAIKEIAESKDDLMTNIATLTKLGNGMARDLDENTIGLDSLKAWQAFTDNPERPQEGHTET